MESNEQSELTSKIETDPQIESTLTAMGRGRLRGRRIKQKGKRTHGHGQQCGDCRGEEYIRGLCGNGTNTIKNF